MQRQLAIDCADVSKSFRRYDGPIDRLREVFLPSDDPRSEFVALHPMNLQVFRGESLGIIGRNGSGKSTLLSMIAGVLTPTTGTITTYGRISALLELGSGFNLDFTGRENVYFAAMLRGLTRDEIDERIDAITAFAEIGSFIDRPVKTYSTGMFVRLAFAIAINMTPDIFIIDEALSVGDIYFQQKCFDRLRDMRANGTTLLFVSHDSGSIYRFCDRALLIEHGHVLLDDVPKQVIERYESRLIAERDATSTPMFDPVDAPDPIPQDRHEIHHENEVSVDRVGLIDATGAVTTTIVSEDRVTVRTELSFRNAFDDPHVGFKIRNRYGDVIFETNTYCMKRTIGPVAAGERVTIDFPFTAALIEGEYTVTLGVADGGYGEGSFQHQLVYRHDLVPFKVLRNLNSIMWSGVVNLFPGCEIERATPSSRTSSARSGA